MQLRYVLTPFCRVWGSLTACFFAEPHSPHSKCTATKCTALTLSPGLGSCATAFKQSQRPSSLLPGEFGRICAEFKNRMNVLGFTKYSMCVVYGVFLLQVWSMLSTKCTAPTRRTTCSPSLGGVSPRTCRTAASRRALAT